MPGSVALAKDLLHARHCLAMLRRLLEDLDDDDLAGLCAVQVIRGDHHVLVDPPVLRLDEPYAALFVKTSDHVAVGRTSTSTIAPFGPPAPVDAERAATSPGHRAAPCAFRAD
jgi:hypothetical protein